MTGEPILTDNAQSSHSDLESVVLMALRSILCVPIKVRERLIGVVYVDNRIQTGAFNQGHLELLTAFASQAGAAIENARLYQIAVDRGRLERELEMAYNIQRGLLPMEFPVLKGYEVAVYWDSANEVAGDFYDCLLMNGLDTMGIIIADVSGKGVPAALFMAVTRSLIRGSAFATHLPDDALRQANRLILNDAEPHGMFVTVYYAVFKSDGWVAGVNAGHNLPLLWRARDGSVEWLPRGGRALGWFEDLPVQARTYHLEPDDVMVFYTDGVTEAENIDHEPFGEGRLADTVKRMAPRCDAYGLKDEVIRAMQDFVGDAPPFDDRTLVVVRYLGQ